MENTKKKRPVLNLLKKFFGNPLVRGPLKSVPLVSVGYEIAETVQHFIDKKRGVVPADAPMPHSIVSMVSQLIGIAGLIYAFLNKWITPEYFFQMTGLGELNPGSFHGPGGGTQILTDSLSK